MEKNMVSKKLYIKGSCDQSSFCSSIYVYLLTLVFRFQPVRILHF